MTACLPAAPAPSASPITVPTTQPAMTGGSSTCGAQISTQSVDSNGGIVGSTDAAVPSSTTTTPALSSAAIDAATASAEATSATLQAVADPGIPGTAGRVPLVVTSIGADGHPDITTLTATSTTNAAAQAAKLTARVDGDGGHVLAVEPEHTVSIDATATDPDRSYQWALDQIDFEHAWDTTSGSGTCVAVLDTGVQLSHPDLAGQVAATDDQTGQGIDDGHGHGTHVAGIIAADADNGIGIAGAAPGVQLLVVKVLNNSGVGNDSQTAAGIIWAVEHGARVINMSLGATCPQAQPQGCVSTAMQNAMDFAQANDVVVVAAGGNNGDPGPQQNQWSWPAAYDWSIAVAATTETEQHASFSTQASYIDVAAPGNDIVSTYKGSAYASMSGTSMAAPFVTAEAALLRAAHPSETADQIRARILGHVTDLGTPGWDSSFGAGLIDPAAALAG